MTPDAIIAALALPDDSRIDQRVPKKHLLEHGATTAADRRRIQDGIDKLRWVAALKPNTVGVPQYHDDDRDYLEIAVLTLFARPDAKSSRVEELIHRAVPHPTILVARRGDEVVVSLAHKRRSRSEAEATVLDGPLIAGTIVAADRPILDGLAVARQPRDHLMALYHGWVEWIEALRASRVTGRFARPPSPEAAEARRRALERRENLQREVAGLRSRATRETQLSRRVNLNLTIRRLEAELAEAIGDL